MAEGASEEEIIASEGRFTPRPRNWPPIRTCVRVLSIDFEILAERLEHWLFEAMSSHYHIRREDSIMAAVKELVTHALFELWNRLMRIAKFYHFATNQRSFQKAPAATGIQYPTFVANMLSRIGPIHVDDSFMSTTIIYAPSEATRENFGRKAMPNFCYFKLLNLMDGLKQACIPLREIIKWKGIDFNGSFFTTCEAVESHPHRDQFYYNVYGSFSSKCYTREDAVMALIFGPFGSNLNPFEDPSLTIGFVDDQAVVDAFRRLPVENGEAGPDNEDPAIWGTFKINHFGIASSSNVPVKGRGEGLHVLGRGNEKFCGCSLARNICQSERWDAIRERLPFTPTREVDFTKRVKLY